MREVWGTFSVKDHLRDRAFIAEALLYDRLVIPVPPPRDRREWQRWERKDWNPDQLAVMLDSLGDKARQVPWDQDRQERWQLLLADAARAVDSIPGYAFAATRIELTRDLPEHVTGVHGVASYPSRAAFDAEVDLVKQNVPEVEGAGAVTAVLARKFLEPVGDLPKRDLLKAAVQLSEEDGVRRARRNYWRWLREFASEGVLSEAAAEVAVREMNELVEEENARTREMARNKTFTLVAKYAFLITSLALVSAPPGAKTAAGAFVSVGNFALGQRAAPLGPDPNAPSAVFLTEHKDLGWR